MAELQHCLLDGPGVFVIRDMYTGTDLADVDRASEAFTRIIEREKTESGVKGDHFAPAGNNDRVWNSFQKHAMEDPEGFVRYYSNEVL